MRTTPILGIISFTALALAIGCSVRDDATSASSDIVVSNPIVISQVFGGGGNAGAPFNHDFVELFNRGTSPASLEGLAIQYTSSGSNFKASADVLKLPNVMLDPGRYFLIQLGTSSATTGAPLPTPDLDTDVVVGDAGSSAITMAKDKGKVALVGAGALLDGCGASGNPCAMSAVLDFVGYGNATQSEGVTVPTLSSTTAAIRRGGGCTDTNDNQADFEVSAPTPHSGTTTNAVSCAEVAADAGSSDDASSSDSSTSAPDAAPASLVLLNEIKINPPTGQDAPWEYAEVLCTPGASLAGYYFVAIEGDGETTGGGSPGMADMVIDLSAKPCGANGIVLIKAASGGHEPQSPETSVVVTAALSTGASPFENATTSFVIIKSPNAPIVQGTDYDAANSGTLALPDGASVIDGVSTFEQADGVVDVTYAPRLQQASGSADAAARIPGNTTPLSVAAWYSGDLEGSTADSLTFNAKKASPNFPATGWLLTPGATNVQTTSAQKPDGGKGNGGTTKPGDDPSNPTEGASGEEGASTKSSNRRATNETVAPTRVGSSSCAVVATGSDRTGGYAAIVGLAAAMAMTRARRRRLS